MKKLNIYILLLMYGILQSACETNAEIEIPSQEPKYVVAAFLNPGSNSQTLTLSISDPIFDGVNNEFDDIKNAVITIDNGIKRTKLKYDNNSNAYVLKKDSMMIEYDKDYNITIAHTNKTIITDFRTFSATPIVITDFKVDSIIEDDPFSDEIKSYYAYTKWQDPPNEKNYYCLELFGLEIRSNGDTLRNALSGFYENIYISDEGLNGTIMNATLVTTGYYNGVLGWDKKKSGFEIVVSKIDEHYYRYFKSLQNYYGDDPFTEPILIYTNINSGLGVIGCYKPFSRKKLL